MSFDQTSVTGTGNTSGYTKNPNENQVDVSVYGTYTGAQFTIQATLDGTNWYDVLAVDVSTGLTVAGGTTIVPGSNATKTWTVPFAVNVTGVRLNVSAFSTGTMTVKFFGASAPGMPQFLSVAGAAGSFTNVTASGTLSVTGASTLTGAVTNPGGITLSSGADLAFSGTTGQNEITVTDNLADALSVKIASGNDLVVFKSTDSAESLFLGSGGSQFIYNRTGVPLVNGLVNVATISTAGAGTYSAANIVSGLILRDPNGSSRADTTATAAQLVAAMIGAAVNDVFDLMIVNTADAAETITLTAGSGVTLVPATITIAQNEVFIGKVRFTNVTGSSEAVTIYGGNVAG